MISMVHLVTLMEWLIDYEIMFDYFYESNN